MQKPQTKVCGFFIKNKDFCIKSPWFAFHVWKKYNRICQYHQLSKKKTQGYEQSAELSNFVKLQWKLWKKCATMQM